MPGALRTVHVAVDSDAENVLRAATLEFMDAVRTAERTVRATRGADPIGDAPPDQISAEQWRAHWRQ